MATGLMHGAACTRLLLLITLLLSAAGARADFVPVGRDALPGGRHVHAANVYEGKLAAVGALYYAHTGDVLRQNDRHERLGSELAIGGAIFPWLLVGAQLEARADFHSGDREDFGLATSSGLITRVRRALLDDTLHVGAEVRALFPAASSAARGLRATSPEFRGLLTHLRNDYALTLNLGARIDHSTRSVADPNRLSAEDRLASQISPSNALLFGCAVSRSWLGFTWLGEFSYDLGLGERAPGALESPMRMELSAQKRADLLLWGAFVGVSPSARPSPDVLTRIEPRVWLGANIGLVLDEPAPAPQKIELAPVREPEPEPVAEPVPELPTEPALPPGQIRGQVRNLRGKALKADIEVQPLGIHVSTDEQGTFLIDVAPGDYQVTVSAPGHTSQTRAALVEQDGVTILVVDLARSEP